MQRSRAKSYLPLPWESVYTLKDEFNGLFLPYNVSGTMPDVAPTLTPAELIVNGGFETAGAGGADIWGTWTEAAGSGTIVNETTEKRTGSNAAKLTYVTGNAYITQRISVFPGFVYNLIFWTRGDGSVGGRYQVYDVSNAAYIYVG